MRVPTTTALLSAICIAGVAQAQTLTAYYDFEGTGADRFDDPAGAFADDLTGQYNPAFSSDVAAATGGTQSASFDGDSALFTQAYTTDLGPDPDAWTIMFWIKARDIEQENNNTRLMSTRRLPDGNATGSNTWQVEGFGDPDNNDGIFDNDGQNGDRMDVRFNGPVNGGGSANWFNPDATNALAREDQGETTAEWHHVVFIASNSGNENDAANEFGATYVDGVRVGYTNQDYQTRNIDGDYAGTQIGNTLGQLIIGGDAVNAGNRAFVGLLDDIALFAGVVDDADIAAIAAGTMSPADFLSTPGVPGDTDGDGDVDDADLGVSFSNYTGPLAPNTGGKTAADGDVDGDGDVDDADLGASFAAYTGPTAPAAVPEPTSLALLGLGGLLAVRRRRA